TFDGEARSLSVILNGPLAKPRLSEVMGHELGLCFDRLRKSLRQRISNPTVELLALAPHHSGIGRILSQRMLEDVSRIRRFAANEDQLASGKVRESSLQRRARKRSDSSQQPIRELATDGGANLCDLPDFAKPIKTCGQRA